MKTIRFNYAKLSKDILTKRQKEDLSFRTIAKVAKINATLLYRAEVGETVLSCGNFAKIVSWLGNDVSDYFTSK
jgi:predicted transcriptional regulator